MSMHVISYKISIVLHKASGDSAEAKKIFIFLIKGLLYVDWS